MKKVLFLIALGLFGSVACGDETCIRAVECVTECGGERVDAPTCGPCPAGSVDTLECPFDSGAGDSAAGDTGTTDGGGTDTAVPMGCTPGTGPTSCWTDPESNLVWVHQNAMPFCTPAAADAYCAALSACGDSDWRLPTIDELRSLVRGCSGTVSTGPCPIREGSTPAEFTTDCFCDVLEGTGPGGCYWDAALGAGCAMGRAYWSSSPSGPGTRWSITFHNARMIVAFESMDSHFVRCVRGM